MRKKNNYKRKWKKCTNVIWQFRAQLTVCERYFGSKAFSINAAPSILLPFNAFFKSIGMYALYGYKKYERDRENKVLMKLEREREREEIC
jgi:4-hydroxybenzoate polyprenyltransferase